MIAACIWRACRNTREKDVFTANPIIVKLLAERGALLGNHEYKHRLSALLALPQSRDLPRHQQWFIKIDAAALGRSASLRQEALGEIRHVKWIPAWGEDRMYEHDRGASRLVRFAPALLGCPDSSFSIVTRAARGSKIFKALRNVVRWLRKKARTPGTSTPPSSSCPPEQGAPAEHKVAERKRHSRCLVRFRFLETSRFSRRKMA